MYSQIEHFFYSIHFLTRNSPVGHVVQIHEIVEVGDGAVAPLLQHVVLVGLVEARELVTVLDNEARVELGARLLVVEAQVQVGQRVNRRLSSTSCCSTILAVATSHALVVATSTMFIASIFIVQDLACDRLESIASPDDASNALELDLDELALVLQVVEGLVVQERVGEHHTARVGDERRALVGARLEAYVLGEYVLELLHVELGGARHSTLDNHLLHDVLLLVVVQGGGALQLTHEVERVGHAREYELKVVHACARTRTRTRTRLEELVGRDAVVRLAASHLLDAQAERLGAHHLLVEEASAVDALERATLRQRAEHVAASPLVVAVVVVRVEADDALHGLVGELDERVARVDRLEDHRARADLQVALLQPIADASRRCCGAGGGCGGGWRRFGEEGCELVGAVVDQVVFEVDLVGLEQQEREARAGRRGRQRCWRR